MLAFWTVVMRICTCNSPHGVEIIIRWHIVFIIAIKAQLISIALMYEVPELFRTERLHIEYMALYYICLDSIRYSIYYCLKCTQVIH